MPRAAKSKLKDPRASHLYTDDNPSTTLHGTGFKDRATAIHTIDLVKNRSLTYQFQTINTMLYRAKGHPHKTAGILEAIDVFADWTSTYAARKAEMKVFKVLPRDLVEEELRTVERINEDEELIDVEFARRYISLPKGKRLANTLRDPAHPEAQDLEVWRYSTLCELVSDDVELYQDGRKSIQHLKMIMFAYSPEVKRKK